MAAGVLNTIARGWSDFRPHPVQACAWNCLKRIVYLPCGRGSGKTEMARRRLILHLGIEKPWPDPRYFYAAPTHKHARELAWDQLLQLIPEPWLDKDRTSSGRLTIFTRWGSRIMLTGLSDKKRSDIEGFQWDGGVIDESSDVAPGLFGRVVLPALSHRRGWCWRIGAPKRQGIGAAEFRRMCEAAARGDDPDSACFSWPSRDILPPDIIEMMRRTLDPKDFLEQCEATWQSAGGGIFYTFDRQYNVRPVAYHPDKPLIVGSDFNVSPMAWVIGHRYPDRIEWLKELFLRDANTRAALDTLYQLYRDHQGGFEFYGDATGAARKTAAAETDYAQILNDERFKRLGRTVHYPPTNPPIADRFAACNAMLLNAAGERRMFIDPGCVNLIADLENRYYKPGTREPADPPGSDVGHITDAMGYAVYRLFPIRVELEQATPLVTIRQMR